MRPRKHRHLTGRLAKLRDAGIGGNMAVRRTAFVAVGGFDEMLGFALAQVPEASVQHHGAHDWQSGRPLIRGTYVAIGATYTKYVRLGDWVAVLLLLNEVRLAVGNLLMHILLCRRPFGCQFAAPIVEK